MTEQHDDLSLPTVSEKRVAVRVTPDAVRHIRSGHPWIYDRSITNLSHVGKSGDLAVVFSKDRSFLAIGLFDPDSPIRIKVLHAGKPRPVDQSFWLNRIRTAMQIRSQLGKSSDTSGYRCVNGENDNMAGLILDRYGSTYVVKLYSSAWIPHLNAVVASVVEVCSPKSIVLRLSRLVSAGNTFGLSDGQTLFGPHVSEPTTFTEHGLAFEVDVVRGQKTGHFLDQRDNRAEVGRRSKGAKMLDVFSCTGGFAVHAAAGGAREVTCVDQSDYALAGVDRNFDLNRHLPVVAACDVSTIKGDANEILASMVNRSRPTPAGGFDVVVIDPPSFAQKQDSIRGALRSYERLSASGVKLVRNEGLLFQASCSSRVTPDDFERAVAVGARSSGRPFQIIDRFGHGIDHPVTFAQGGYLKAVLIRVGV